MKLHHQIKADINAQTKIYGYSDGTGSAYYLQVGALDDHSIEFKFSTQSIQKLQEIITELESIRRNLLCQRNKEIAREITEINNALSNQNSHVNGKNGQVKTPF